MSECGYWNPGQNSGILLSGLVYLGFLDWSSQGGEGRGCAFGSSQPHLPLRLSYVSETQNLNELRGAAQVPTLVMLSAYTPAFRGVGDS